MFGIKDGFNIVIGNPPYVGISKLSYKTKLQKIGYQTFDSTGDLYSIFYEKGNHLLKKNGILTYITSRQWVNAGYGKSLRKYFIEQTNPIKLIDFGIGVKQTWSPACTYKSKFGTLKYMAPVGGEDMDKIQGDVTLTFAESNESAVLLLGDKESRPPHIGEVIYKDNISAICRRWNWKEVDRTKLTEETKNCFIVIEGLPPVDKDKVEKTMSELAELVKKYCGGEVTTTILDKANPQVQLS